MRISLIELRRNLLSLWMAVLMCGTTLGQAEVNSEHHIGVWTIDPLMTQAQEQKALAKLNEPSEFQWKDEPLAGVVEQVGLRLPFVLHRRAIEEIGLSLETPVTAQGGETIGVALTLALRGLDLTYTIRAGSVEITTIEDAENNSLVRVYDVTPLVSFEGWPVTNRTIDVQSLADLIFTAVGPDTWESGQRGFPSMVVGDRVVMVIRHLRETHAETRMLGGVRGVPEQSGPLSRSSWLSAVPGSVLNSTSLLHEHSRSLPAGALRSQAVCRRVSRSLGHILRWQILH
jgi:hypothetical protein